MDPSNSKLVADFPELSNFLGAAAADWDYDYSTVREALACHLSNWGSEEPLIRSQALNLIERIDEYLEELSCELNVEIENAQAARMIISTGILGHTSLEGLT